LVNFTSEMMPSLMSKKISSAQTPVGLNVIKSAPFWHYTTKEAVGQAYFSILRFTFV